MGRSMRDWGIELLWGLFMLTKYLKDLFFFNLLVSEDMTLLLSRGAQVILAAGLLNTTL